MNIVYTKLDPPPNLPEGWRVEDPELLEMYPGEPSHLDDLIDEIKDIIDDPELDNVEDMEPCFLFRALMHIPEAPTGGLYFNAQVFEPKVTQQDWDDVIAQLRQEVARGSH